MPPHCPCMAGPWSQTSAGSLVGSTLDGEAGSGEAAGAAWRALCGSRKPSRKASTTRPSVISVTSRRRRGRPPGRGATPRVPKKTVPEHGQTEGAPSCCKRLQDGGGRTDLVVTDLAHDDVEERHEDHAHAEAVRRQRRGQAPSRRCRCPSGTITRYSPTSPTAISAESEVEDPAAQLVHHGGAEAGAEERADRPRGHGQAGPHRAVARDPSCSNRPDDEREADDRSEEDDDEADPGGVRAPGQHTQLDQRRPPERPRRSLVDRRTGRSTRPRPASTPKATPASPARGPAPAGRPAGTSRPPASSAPDTSSRRPPSEALRPAAAPSRRRSGRRAPSGRLMAKTMRQPVPNMSASMSAPATTGPRIVDSPITGPSAPNALPICCGREQVADQPEALRDHHRGEQPLHDPGPDQHLRVRAPPRRRARRRRSRPRRSAASGGGRTGRPSRPPVSRPTASASV